MAFVYPFERLVAWQLSRTFYHDIRNLTQTFPRDERYELASQMNRAAHSIVSNIAEGSARRSHKEQARFYNMSFSSLMEVANNLLLISDRKLVDNELCSQLHIQCQEIFRVLSGLIKATKT